VVFKFNRWHLTYNEHLQDKPTMHVFQHQSLSGEEPFLSSELMELSDEHPHRIT
jgi:hypothetical protein